VTESPDTRPGDVPSPPPKRNRSGRDDRHVVIRDNRKIRPTGEVDTAGEGAPVPAGTPSGVPADAPGAGPGAVADAATEEAAEPIVTEPVAEPPAGPAADESAVPSGGGGLGAELEALRTALDERTRDLQRISAEYANYRKRVERDRGQVVEQATGNVLSALLPVLDDLDRAREHGELVEGIAAVAEQLVATTTKFGLAAFGEKGDPFDPNRHDAAAHLTSDEVTQPTCIDILRRGYLLGDRLLRPALVAVADPAGPS
jgi:molecular chaperone GrpE